MAITATRFLASSTVHQADVTWWWAEDKVHDSDYTIMVNDSMRQKAKELEREFDVTDDTRYCCQWEGIQLLGEDKAKVDAAGLQLARHLARFKGVIPLDFYETTAEALAPTPLKLPVGHRALRWVAESQARLDGLTKDLTRNGCVFHSVKPLPSPSKEIEFVFSLDPAKVLLTLGFFPNESDWIDK